MAKISGCQDCFHMGCLATGFPELFDLIIKSLPVSGQNMISRDDDIDLTCSSFDGLFDLSVSLGQRCLSGRKSCCN
jgi:hypothetical protein